MKSTFYYGGDYLKVAEKIRASINAVPDFLSRQTAHSPRAVGDALESLISERFDTFLGDWCAEYSKDFARRAMADLAFTDTEGFYSRVDVRTHRRDTRFNMPNLTSVERLARFYESDTNVFSLILVTYDVKDTSIIATDVQFLPIEFLNWDCLTVGALGWGQIQIANSNAVKVVDGYSRKQWMLQLCDVMLQFYPKEILKIRDRIDRFGTVRATWESRKDIWK